MAAPPNDQCKKLLLLGDNGVRKTSLLLLDLLLKFLEIPIGIDVSVKTIDQTDDGWVNLQICDPTGQQRLFKKITGSCYLAADGILLVYDVTNELSLKHVKDWIRKNICSCSDIKVKKILVWNKADMDDEGQRAVPRCKGQALADACGIMFLEVSTKTKKNVELVFFALAIGM